MPEHVVLRFKWLCVEVDLDVDGKDKVTLLDLVMIGKMSALKLTSLYLKIPHLVCLEDESC